MRSSPTLYAGNLEKLSRMQTLVAEAFACSTAAQSAWAASGHQGSVAELLDRAMQSMRVEPAL